MMPGFFFNPSAPTAEKKVYTNLPEFLRDAGMDYNIRKIPALRADSAGIASPVANQFHLERSDGAIVSPHTVSRLYSVLQPSDIMAELEPFVLEGWATPDAGIILREGQKDVIVLRLDGGSLPDGGNIAGQDWIHYLSVHNAYGMGAALGSVTSFRLVCCNTVARAARAASIRVTHKGDVKERFSWAVRSWKQVQEAIARLSARMSEFSRTPMSWPMAEETANRILEVEDLSKISTRKEHVRDAILAEFNNPARGTRGGSVADLFNAVTAVNSHWSPRISRVTPESRLESILDGSRGALEEKALAVLGRMVGVED